MLKQKFLWKMPKNRYKTFTEFNSMVHLHHTLCDDYLEKYGKYLESGQKHKIDKDNYIYIIDHLINSFEPTKELYNECGFLSSMMCLSNAEGKDLYYTYSERI